MCYGFSVSKTDTSLANTPFLKFAGLIGEFNLKNDNLLLRNFGHFSFKDELKLWRGYEFVFKSDL